MSTKTISRTEIFLVFGDNLFPISYFEKIFSHCDSDLFIDDDGMFSFQTTKEERDNIILGNDKDILIQRNY